MKQREKKIAAGSLLAMGIGWLTTLPFGSSVAVGIVQRGFEAGLVGGIADWFAVTALFRHPLGLRIPHTALLPRKRTQLTHAVLNVVEQWASKESIIAHVEKHTAPLHVLLTEIDRMLADRETTRRLAHWLETQATAHLPSFTPALTKMCIQIVSSGDGQAIQRLLIDALNHSRIVDSLCHAGIKQFRQWVASPEGGTTLGQMGLSLLGTQANKGMFGMLLQAMSGMLDAQRLGSLLQQKLLDALEEEQARIAFVRTWLDTWKKDVLETTSFRQQIIVALQKLSDSPTAQPFREAVETSIASLWTHVFCASSIEQHLLPFLQQHLRHWLEDTATLEHGNRYIRRYIVQWIEQNYGLLRTLLQKNANRTSDHAFLETIETHIGHELQWIRVNGALCGFFVGIFLGSIHVLWIR
jgi:uncharacterized membrane-anchored protein YjiN (DUF445 family)